MTHARRMSETPTQLHTLRDTVPPALDHVIGRALAKIPADRYATASQFGQALQAVLFAATPAAHADLSMTPGPMATTPTAVGPQPEVKSRRWWLLAIPVVAIGLVAILWPPSGWFGDGPLEITTSNIVHVTNDPGLEFQPAMSPDGREVAYVEGPIGNPRLVVQSTIDIGSGGESRLGEAARGSYWFPAWTPDGASIRLWACVFGFGSDCDWKEVGSRGGSVRAVSVPRTSDHHAWSPDGTRVAFSVGDSIFAYSINRGEPELLGVHVMEPSGLHSFVWSPDGRRIAYVNGNRLWRISANVAGASIWILDANGGEPVPVTRGERMNVSPQWLPDSRHLVFVSNRDGPRGIYVAEVGPEGPRGPPRSVLGAADPHSISISADGRRLSYAKFAVVQNIWSIPIPRSDSVSIRDAVPVTTDNQVIEEHTLSPDGEWIAFGSDIRGQFDIYKQPLAGGHSQPQLVADMTGDTFDPDWSPDGAEIAFYSKRPDGTGRGEVFVVSANGGTPQQVTDFPGRENLPDWSPDGLAIAFNSQGPQGVGRLNTWIVSRDSVGGPWSDPVRLTDFGCWWPDWAPDGGHVLCHTGLEMVLVSREGTILARHNPLTDGRRGFGQSTFSPDGSRIYFFADHEDGSEGVWWIPTNGGDASKVVAFDNPFLSVSRLTVGPENIYLTISEYESDIWVMDLDW